jgi:ADP-dependent NAD(P)H-hydrate dehydratase / NAD(P)H-hydrate epimerase
VRPVLTAAEMKAADAAAQAEVGIDALVWRAGNAVAGCSLRLLGGAYGRRIVVVAGKGNNGADGRVAAELLRRRGAKVHVIEARSRPKSVPDCDLVLDAAFGTGFRGVYEAPDPTPRAIVLAVDIPSGISADIGQASDGAVVAHHTITFAALKPGLLLDDGPAHAGCIEVADIGIDVGTPRTHLVEDADEAGWLPRRRREDHKWDAAVYVAAGSPGMLGAAMLAARSAMRAGAGMVRLGVPGADPSDLPASEAVARILPADQWALPVLDDLSRCRALVLGPGLGTSPAATAAVRRLVVDVPVPMVLDADGLNALGTVDEAAPLFARRRHPVVLTPHDGEFACLVGARPGHDRVGAALELAERLRAHVLLKGSTTVIAAPSGEVLLAASGSSRLATAGTGDVLSGVIGAFLARGMEPARAAALAAHVHGRAAGRGSSVGLVAGDLPDLISHELSLNAAPSDHAPSE